MTEQISPNERAVPAHRPPSPERVVNVEIDELIFDGFGPLDSSPGDSTFFPRAESFRVRGAMTPGTRNISLNSVRAAAAFRRELARELADDMEGPAAEELAGTIADAVFRQLAAAQRRRGPQRRDGAR